MNYLSKAVDIAIGSTVAQEELWFDDVYGTRNGVIRNVVTHIKNSSSLSSNHPCRLTGLTSVFCLHREKFPAFESQISNLKRCRLTSCNKKFYFCAPKIIISFGETRKDVSETRINLKMFDSCEPFSTNSTDHQSESEIGMKKPRSVGEHHFEFAASLSIQNLRSLVERAEVERTSLLW